MITRKMIPALAFSVVSPLDAAFTASTDTVIHCSEASPESFNPQIASSDPSFVASSRVFYNQLVDLDPVKGTPISSLAADWAISPSGKTYTSTLRQGVKFSNSEFFKSACGFNAGDVIFSVSRQKGADHPYHRVSQGSYGYSSDVGLNKLIEEVKKVGDFHVQFVLNEPNTALLTDWGMDSVSILSAEYTGAILKRDTPEDVDSWPISIEPYMLQQYKQDSQIRHLTSPNYWDGIVPMKYLISSVTPGIRTRLAKLWTNEYQIIPTPTPIQFGGTKKGKNLTLHSVEVLNIGYLTLNTKKKPFDNVLVCWALNCVADKKAIIGAILLGSDMTAKSPIPSNIMGFNRDLQDCTYDPQKTKDLLKQVGLESDFETTLWSMSAQHPYDPNSRRAAETIQSDWVKMGVKAKIASYKWGKYPSGMCKSEYDIALFGWMSDNDDPNSFVGVLLGCDNIKTEPSTARWCGKGYNSLVQKMKLVSKPEERAALYRWSQEIFYQQTPWVALANGKTLYVTRNNVSGYSISLMGSDFSKAKLG